jgi:transcription antitermination factor NusA-like protein
VVWIVNCGVTVLKYPLDKICIKSGIYCSHCQYKIESKVVEKEELEILRALVELEERLKFLKKGEYVKSIHIDDEVFVFIRDSFETSELSILEHELSKEIHKRVKVIEYIPDLRRLVEQIMYPATVMGINRVWIPDGTEILNIRVSRRDRKHFIHAREHYEALIEKVSGIKTRIIFE